MNRPIRNLAVACLVLFLALIANATYLQFFQAESLTDTSEHPDNRRVTEASYAAPRGDILVNGQAIARSEPSDDQYDYQRVYTRPRQYASLLGFFSKNRGVAGLESSYNEYLTGEADALFVNRISDLLTNKPPAGGNVVLTINAKAQRAAFDALQALGKDVRAAAVAIEPKTGKILAMVSNPTYDPSAIASHDFSAADAAYDRLKPDDPGSALNNVAIESAVPPGSTFKLVTAAAALSSGRYTPETQVDGARIIDFNDTTADLGNYTGRACGADNRVTLIRALEVSCNVAFASVGIDLGPEALREQAEKFGFNDTTPYFTDLNDLLTRQAPSNFPVLPARGQASLGQSSVGQFDVRATPLQMAMVGAGIANGGKVMKPYLVSEIRSSDLDVVKAFDPELYSQAISSSVADDLKQMMVSVVENGTATNAAIPGVQVGGKTGTAQLGGGRKPYAWFVSLAPADDPQVAVAVVILDTAKILDRGCSGDISCDGGVSGNGMAAPIARAIMEAVLNK